MIALRRLGTNAEGSAVGAIAGGVAAALVAVCLALFCVRRRKRARRLAGTQAEGTSPAPAVKVALRAPEENGVLEAPHAVVFLLEAAGADAKPPQGTQPNL